MNIANIDNFLTYSWNLTVFSFLKKLTGQTQKAEPKKTQPSGTLYPIAQAIAHVEVTVAVLKLPHIEIDRLAQLGLHQGCVARVIQASDKAAVLVAVGDCRIALNQDTAKKIYVY